jgi:hypothetical protein
MGLDMYLNARCDVGYEDEIAAGKVAALFPELKKPVKAIFIEVAYWRKANAIHGWFVNNVQGNKDDCNSYYVDRETLQLLLDRCKEVLNNKDKASEMLPPTPGFFFGTAETDDWYWWQIESTIEQLEECLKLPTIWSFTYQSSW